MKKLGFVCFLGLAALTAGCGNTNGAASGTKIVGGERVTSTDAVTQSTVALVAPSGQTFCTGSLIARDLVVTASHCLAGYNESKLYVAFGTIARSGYFAKERIRTAAHFAVHQSYNSREMAREVAQNAPNDIALIRLSAAAPAAYAPVAMLKASDELRIGEALTLTGFGLTRHDAEEAGVLYKVTTTLTKVSPRAKEIEFGRNPGKSACMGDSGGPAFVERSGKLVLVGVTSRGSEYCDEKGIYTDVRQFQAWITSTARSL